MIKPLHPFPAGSTPNWALAGWKRMPVDFGWRTCRDLTRVTIVRPLDVLTVGLGISRSEARRRLERGTVRLCQSIVGFASVEVEPGCVFTIDDPKRCIAVEVTAAPTPSWRCFLARLLDALGLWWVGA